MSLAPNRRQHTPSNGQTTSVPLLDVGRGNGALREQILEAIAAVCHSGRFLFGPECAQLEQALAERCQTEHALGCASCSDSLLLALMALNVGRGDEVIVPSFTFFATASAVWRLGATPVFVDIDPATFNVDPEAIRRAVTRRTKAIIPVHLFGQCAEMEAILDVARWHSLRVIEDAAQAIGASYDGRPAGSMGDVGCFSFYPTKNLGGFGDGGMMTTNNAELAARLRLLAGHGMRSRYYHDEVGINSRLDSIQAAVLCVKLAHLDDMNRDRAANAAAYERLFAAASLDEWIATPQTAPQRGHVWNQYTIRVGGGRRNALHEHLAAANVGTAIYYPVPLHRQECFSSLGYRAGSLRETERAADEVLSLPIFPELTPTEQQTVVAEITRFFEPAQAADDSAEPRRLAS